MNIINPIRIYTTNSRLMLDNHPIAWIIVGLILMIIFTLALYIIFGFNASIVPVLGVPIGIVLAGPVTRWLVLREDR